MSFSRRIASRTFVVAVPIGILFWATVAPLYGQVEVLSARDSADLVKEARERQVAFEAFRASRIPLTPDINGGRCDERIGRMCIWFGGEAEEDFPPEPLETEQARRGLIGVFLEARSRIQDPWITGQLVRYLIEQGDFRLAEEVSRTCGLAASWWCSALFGYVLHLIGDFVESEEAFLAAIASMPDEEREFWTTPGYLFTRDRRNDFRREDPDDQSRNWELFWRFSDPLFLFEGNDRLTEHFARLVEARNQRDAGSPQAMEWEDDLEETLLRYGRTVGWSRVRGARPGFGRPLLQDNRRVIAHHHPKSRGYLFPEEFLGAPADVPPESWITAPREARTWYAPPYAPDFTSLATQIGRFRRGPEMLVVGAYRPALSATEGALDDSSRERADRTRDPFRSGRPSPDEPESASAQETGVGEISGPVEAGLFLLPEQGGEAIEIRSRNSEGVFTLLAPPGRYVSSLEVIEPDARRAWRARQGVSQGLLTPGLVAVSDLLILTEGAPFPSILDEAIPHVRPGIRIGNHERFTVVWEVYGLQVREPIQVTLGFTRGRPGFLQRVGEFLGVLEPDRRIDLTFTDAGPDAVQTAFRAVALELPDLDPGEYTLHLRLDLSGREPAIVSRPITVIS